MLIYLRIITSFIGSTACKLLEQKKMNTETQVRELYSKCQSTEECVRFIAYYCNRSHTLITMLDVCALTKLLSRAQEAVLMRLNRLYEVQLTSFFFERD